MIQTFNIELKLNPQAFAYWHQQLVAARKAYNECSEFLYRNDDVPLALKPVHDAVYATLRKHNPELPAQAVIKVYKDVLAAFRSVRKNKHRIKRAPRKNQLNMRLDKRLYTRIQADGIVMGSGTDKRELVPFVLYPKAVEMLATYTTHDPMLFERNGRIFLAVPFEVPEKPVLSETSIGVDLGLRRLFVTTDGVAFRDKKYLEERRKCRHNKKQLKARNTKSARRKLRKLKRRERNLSKDMCYRAANALLASTDADIIVLEDLEGIKKKTSKFKNGYKRKSHNRRIGQAPIRGFRDILTHKAQRVGKRVETVSPTYTSQTDSRTGKRNGTRRGCRYICSDGVVLDADWNASYNIAKRGKHPVSNRLPKDGGLKFLTGRALSTARKRCKPPKRKVSEPRKPLNL